jgi:hypothetical protein
LGVLYFFHGEGKFVKFFVSSDRKVLKVCSDLTNNVFVDFIKRLVKDGKHKEALLLKLKIKGLSDEAFDKYVINEFKSTGYSLLKKKENVEVGDL